MRRRSCRGAGRAATRRTRTARTPSTRPPTSVTARASVSRSPLATSRSSRRARSRLAPGCGLHRLAERHVRPPRSAAPASRRSARTSAAARNASSPASERCDQVGNEWHRRRSVETPCGARTGDVSDPDKRETVSRRPLRCDGASAEMSTRHASQLPTIVSRPRPSRPRAGRRSTFRCSTRSRAARAPPGGAAGRRPSGLDVCARHPLRVRRDRLAVDRRRPRRHAGAAPRPRRRGATTRASSAFSPGHRSAGLTDASLVGSIMAGGVVLPIVAVVGARDRSRREALAARRLPALRARRRVGVVSRDDAPGPPSPAGGASPREAAGGRELPLRAHRGVDRRLLRARAAPDLADQEPRGTGRDLGRRRS